MKIFFISMLLIFALSINTYPVRAADANNHDASISEVISDIMAKQQVSDVSDINCDAVSDDEWVDLGEAVMSLMHPDETTHEAMDNMMGGEGSDSLRLAHINMGQNYLGCGAGNYGMMGGMMGNGMMNYGGTNRNSFINQDNSAFNSERSGFAQMGMPWMFSGLGWGWMVLMWLIIIIFWVAVIAAIIWLVKLLINRSSQSPMDLLKTRYARGEINKTEFDKMKKDLS